MSLEYTTTDLDKYDFSTIDFRTGWELGLDILKFKIFGGYEQYLITDNDQPTDIDYTFSSFVAGLGVKSEFNKFAVYGLTFIPIHTRFDNDTTTKDADLRYIQFGISYNPLPLVEIFVNYRNLDTDSGVVDISSKAYTAGTKIRF